MGPSSGYSVWADVKHGMAFIARSGFISNYIMAENDKGFRDIHKTLIPTQLVKNFEVALCSHNGLMRSIKEPAGQYCQEIPRSTLSAAEGRKSKSGPSHSQLLIAIIAKCMVGPNPTEKIS